MMNNTRKSLFEKLNLPPQFQYLLLLYVTLVLFFGFHRLLFHLSFSDQYYSVVSIGQIFQSYLIGFRFDQIIILAFLTPLLLILPWFDLRNKPLKLFVTAYSCILFPILFLGMIADIRFYEYFNIRLNFMAYEYTGGEGLNNKFVNADRLFIEYISIWIVTSILFIILHSKVLIKRVANKYSYKNRIIWLLCFLLLFAGGIRGRISLAPMDWGIAYFSDNHTLNQSALNGIYTLFRNYTETEHDPRLSFLDENERFPFVSREKALSDIREMISITEFDSQNSSLKQTIKSPHKFEFQPNIIIVLMESWSGTRTSSLGADKNLTPYFDSLAGDGIYFRNFYANGFRTNFGLAATLCSYPALPGRSILKRYESKHPFISLSEILHDDGYYNLFCYGGDFAFDNMEGFFRSKKYDAFYGEEIFDFDQSFSKWGVPDHILFERINQMVDSLPRPFQLSTLTLSNHEPFEIPDSSIVRFFDDSFESKKNNAMLYADYAVGQFMATMKTKPLFDSTIFLFVSDHSLLEASNMSLNPNLFHVPLLIYSPTLLGDSAVIIEKIGSQVDILPTLLGLLGGEYQTESWGRDLLNLPDDDSGFAIVNLWDRIGYLDTEYFYFEQIGQYSKLYSNNNRQYSEVDTTQHSSALMLLRNRLRSYSQLADQLTLP